MKQSKPSHFSKVCQHINAVYLSSNRPTVEQIKLSDNLQTDLNFDSLELAELSVRLESEFGVDVFAVGFPATVSEIIDLVEE